MMKIRVMLVLALCLAGCVTGTPRGDGNKAPLTDDGRQIVPNALVLSETNVFAQADRTHALMKDVFVVVKMLEATRSADRLFLAQAQFMAGQKIEWARVWSARPPEYCFRGSWRAMDDGTLVVMGRYEPTGDATPLPPELQGSFRFLVPTVVLRRGEPPYTHTLELWIKQLDRKAGAVRRALG